MMPLFTLLLACAEEPPPSADDPLDQLRALGYIDEAEGPADPQRAGAELLDPARVQPGLRLVTTAKECLAQLIRHTGEVVRSWDGGDHCFNWSNAELWPDGVLRVPSRDFRRWWQLRGPGDFPYPRSLIAFDLAGRELWRSEAAVHHDAHVQRDGRVLALDGGRRRIPELHPEVDTLDNGLVLLDAEGRLLRSWSFYDMLTRPGSPVRVRPVAAARSEEGERYVDLFHTNAVELIEDPALAERTPVFQVGRALVTFRHQDLIILFDLDEEAAVWSWGRGELDGPHDAQVLPSGNVLIFDNGLARGWSRVIELDPRSGELVWSYGSPSRADEAFFYTRGRGAAQRLPNGNTLIADSNNGEAREVTPEGDIVWRWYNPILGEGGTRAAIVRMKHVPDAWIAPATTTPAR